MCNTLPAVEAILNSTHIEIGISAVLSGPDGAYETNSNAATILAIQEVNASPDVLPGITLIPTFTDDAGEFAYGLISVLCLGKRGVPVIHGPSYSGASIGAAIVARDLGIPVVATSATSPQLNSRDASTGYPTFNRIIISDEFQGAALVKLAVEFGWNKVVTLSVALDVYTTSLASAFANSANIAGVNIALSQSMVKNDSGDELIVILNQIKSSGSKIVFAFLYPEQILNIFPLAKSLGMIGPEWVWVGCDSWIDKATALGDELNDNTLFQGVIGTQPYISEDADEWRAFSDSWESIPLLDPDLQADLADQGMYDFPIDTLDPPYGEPADGNAFPAYNYDAVWFIAKAIQKVITEGELEDVKDTTKMLSATRSTTMKGASGYISLDTDGNMKNSKFQVRNIINGGTENIVAGILEADDFFWRSEVLFNDGTTDIPIDGILDDNEDGSMKTLINAAVTAFMALFLTIAIFYNKKTSNDQVLEIEDASKRENKTTEEEVRSRFKRRVLAQRLWTCMEIGDWFSDFGTFTAYAAFGYYDTLFYLYLILFCITTPAFIHNVSVRKRILEQYADVLNNKDTIAAYAKVLYQLKAENGTVSGEEEEQITADSIGIRLQLVTVDMKLAKLGMTSALIEDAPCIVINALVILGVLGNDAAAAEMLVLGFAVVSLVVSSLMIGRKMALPSHHSHLMWEKWDLEVELSELSDARQLKVREELEHTHAGDQSSSKRGSVSVETSITKSISGLAKNITEKGVKQRRGSGYRVSNRVAPTNDDVIGEVGMVDIKSPKSKRSKNKSVMRM